MACVSPLRTIDDRRVEDTYPDVSPTAEDLLLSKEQTRQISEALQSLPENQRMAVILKRYDDLRYEEIARLMGCSVSAVESLLVRAKKALQQKLSKLQNDRRFLVRELFNR